MSNIQERITDISTMGANRTIIETNSLLKDVVQAISLHYALPMEDLSKVIEDEI